MVQLIIFVVFSLSMEMKMYDSFEACLVDARRINADYTYNGTKVFSECCGPKGDEYVCLK